MSFAGPLPSLGGLSGPPFDTVGYAPQILLAAFAFTFFGTAQAVGASGVPRLTLLLDDGLCDQQFLWGGTAVYYRYSIEARFFLLCH